MRRATKFTAIQNGVKGIVFARDDGKCVLCGSIRGVPDAHVIPRSRMGRGIEQNIVTLCPECHRAYDQGQNIEKFGKGTTRESLQCYLIAYLKQFYPNWTKEEVTYKKWNSF